MIGLSGAVDETTKESAKAKKELRGAVSSSAYGPRARYLENITTS